MHYCRGNCLSKVLIQRNCRWCSDLRMLSWNSQRCSHAHLQSPLVLPLQIQQKTDDHAILLWYCSQRNPIIPGSQSDAVAKEHNVHNVFFVNVWCAGSVFPWNKWFGYLSVVLCVSPYINPQRYPGSTIHSSGIILRGRNQKQQYKCFVVLIACCESMRDMLQHYLNVARANTWITGNKGD